MANQTSGNPVVIDTFGSDVTISSNKVQVTSIVMEGATAGDTATFLDRDGNEVLRLSNSIGSASVVWSPAEAFRFNGLTFDDSASSLAANDFVFIFLK